MNSSRRDKTDYAVDNFDPVLIIELTGVKSHSRISGLVNGCDDA